MASARIAGPDRGLGPQHRDRPRDAARRGHGAAHSGAHRRARARPAAAAARLLDDRAAARRLSPVVLLLASTHFLVDGYGNVLAPLLPLLIPRLDLSLAAAGTLQMVFQLATSVAQLGVRTPGGPMATPRSPRRWPARRRDADDAGRARAGCGDAGPGARGGRARRGGLPSSGSRARAPLLCGAARVWRCRSTSRAARLARRSRRSLFAPFVQQFGLAATPWLMVPALLLLAGTAAAEDASRRAAARLRGERRPCGAATVSQAAVPALRRGGAQDADGVELRHLRARDAHPTRSVGGRGGRGRVHLPRRCRHRRVLRRRDRRPLRRAAHHHRVARRWLCPSSSSRRF